MSRLNATFATFGAFNKNENQSHPDFHFWILMNNRGSCSRFRVSKFPSVLRFDLSSRAGTQLKVTYSKNYQIAFFD